MSQLWCLLECRHEPSSTAGATEWEQSPKKLRMAKFRISSAATEDLKCILERQIHLRRWFGVVVSALVLAGVQAWTLQHCKSNRMRSEPAKAEHNNISNFAGCGVAKSQIWPCHGCAGSDPILMPLQRWSDHDSTPASFSSGQRVFTHIAQVSYTFQQRFHFV